MTRKTKIAVLGGASLVLMLGAAACVKRILLRPDSTDPLEPIERVQPSRAPAPAPPSQRVIGTNLAENNRSSSAYPFVDLMKNADPFFSGASESWEDGRALELDEHGWVQRLAPGQIARSFVVSGDNPHHLAGEFIVLFEGEGRIEYFGGAEVLEQAPGRHRIRVAAPSGLWIEIHETNPENHLRAIHIVPSGGRCASDAAISCTEDSQCDARCVPHEEDHQARPIASRFIRENRPFGIARFMDWQRTNALSNADDEPRPEWWPMREFASWPTEETAFWRPVPASIIAKTANELRADAWVCIPHMASDDFVREFSQALKDNLSEDLNVYIELSNEYWNDIFAQHQEINAEGCRRYSGDPAGDCDPDGNGVLCEYTEWNQTQRNCLEYGERYFAVRTAEIGAIAREVLGESRVTRVLATQIGAVADRGARMLEASWRGDEAVHRAIDAVAVAPYFGAGDVDWINGVDDAFQQNSERTHGAPPGSYRVLSGPPEAEYGGVYRWMHEDVRTLSEREDFAHIRLLAYEGGQHFVARQEGPRYDLYLAINRDSRMKEVYAQYLSYWRELTGDAPFVHFTSASLPSIWGQWGVQEYEGQARTEAPKYDALLDAIEAHGSN